MTEVHRIEARLNAIAPTLVDIRRDLHAHPELAFEEYRTSEFLAGELRSYGYEVERGFAGTGVVGSLSRGTGERRPGCYLGLGIGETRAPLHSPHYDFNDGCIVGGAPFWTKLAQDYLS